MDNVRVRSGIPFVGCQCPGRSTGSLSMKTGRFFRERGGSSSSHCDDDSSVCGADRRSDPTQSAQPKKLISFSKFSFFFNRTVADRTGKS